MTASHQACAPGGAAEDEVPLLPPDSHSQIGHFGHEGSRGAWGSAGSEKKKLEADPPGKDCSRIGRFSEHLSHPRPFFIMCPPAF